MPDSPTDCKSWLPLINAFTGLIGATTAFISINSWRKELIQKKKFEAASEAYQDILQTIDAIREIRNPFPVYDEDCGLDEYSRVFSRIQKRREVFSKAKLQKYKSIAALGPAEAAPFNALEDIKNRIAKSASILPSQIKILNNPSSNVDIAAIRNSATKHESIIWEMPEGDEIEKQLKDIESEIQKIYSKTFSRMNWINSFFQIAKSTCQTIKHKFETLIRKP
jgi:hypothetical protein